MRPLELKTLFVHVKYHIGGTISMITNYKIMNVKNNTMSSSRSLLHNQRGNNKSNKYTYNYSNNVVIHSLDIADGLKEILTKYEFTLNDLLNMPSSELAEFLGIDRYIAQIIGGAARKLSNIDNANDKLKTENYITF
jgi:hypothetical protein